MVSILMTKEYKSIYLESEFVDVLPRGTFDLVLISGHATALRPSIRIR